MADEILDYFGEQEPFYAEHVKVIAIRHYYFEPQARLFAARLKEAGVPCFISNSNAITAFPLGEAGIGLHIRASDKERALEILEEFEQMDKEEQDYRDANHADIAFQKELHEAQTNPQKWVFILLAILILLFLVRSLGWLPSWGWF